MNQAIIKLNNTKLLIKIFFFNIFQNHHTMKNRQKEIFNKDIKKTADKPNKGFKRDANYEAYIRTYQQTTRWQTI